MAACGASHPQGLSFRIIRPDQEYTSSPALRAPCSAADKPASTMVYLTTSQRRRRREMLVCFVVAWSIMTVLLAWLRPWLGMPLVTLVGGAVLYHFKRPGWWTRKRLALAFSTCGACLLIGALSARHMPAWPPPAPLSTLSPLPPQPQEQALPVQPLPEVSPPPPRLPLVRGCLPYHRETASCELFNHRRTCMSRYVLVPPEEGQLHSLRSPCVWSHLNTCVAAETRYQCRGAFSTTFLLNLLRGFIAVLCLAFGLPMAMPYLRKMLPSYGVLDVEAYERQCEITTEKELGKLREYIQMRGVPARLSAHAQERGATFVQGLSGFRRVDALKWVQHVMSPEKRSAVDGFAIGEDGRRLDVEDDEISLSDGSESDPESYEVS